MNINIKTIGQLKDYKFFVPSYQRGYRWTQQEVNALLNDIDRFSSKEDKKYCIQPLIVKKREDGSYEVVDGQQRLTTIYIFMKIASQEIRSAVPPFELEYETRSDSAGFLQSLSDENKSYQNDREKNIDFYHIACAYDAVNEWFDSKEDKSVSIQELNTKIRKDVFFIWYEISPDSDPISMFTKVNLGKIPLTNSELIKALLLNKDNFVNKNSVCAGQNEFSAEVNKRQTEISVAWDRIEQGLRKNSFWYFLNQEEYTSTRIDMLFNLLAAEENENMDTKISEDENYFSFLVFSSLMDSYLQKDEFVNKLWRSVEKLYSEFQEWYSDLNKYHIIGYLISSGVKISEIFRMTRGKRKSQIMMSLINKTKDTIGSYENLESLSYDNSNDKKKIQKILLLFNIATLVCKSEKQYRFPFDIYKGGSREKIKWDIEHIHATADEKDEPDDSMGNLTLLDSKTNRGYQNKPFNEKRRIIIERESKGLFVPLCTKNIFLKVYSNNLDKMDIWNKDDKKDYLSAINMVMESFLEGGFINEQY